MDAIRIGSVQKINFTKGDELETRLHDQEWGIPMSQQPALTPPSRPRLGTCARASHTAYASRQAEAPVVPCFGSQSTAV